MIHAAFRPVELDAGDAFGHDIVAGPAHQTVDRFPASHVERNTLARAIIL